jgi:flavodoxin
MKMMKTLVVYYSLGGKTKKIAAEKAEKEGAELLEIKTKKRYSFLSAFFKGTPAAMKQKPVDIQALQCDFAAYDKIILAAPIWGGFPAPPFNSAVHLLPTGKDVEIIFCSGGGGPTKSADIVKELIAKQGCTVVGFTDIKGSK